MLADGELDALVTARAPSTFHKEPDEGEAAVPELRRGGEGVLPAHEDLPHHAHRRDPPRRVRREPWVAQSLYKAFTAAKAKAYELYNQTAALPAMLPVAHGADRRGTTRNGRRLVAVRPRGQPRGARDFLRYHHEQGLSKRRLAPEELFARETLKLVQSLMYRGMDRAALDAAYNNGAAVKDSAQIVADWEARSARLRAGHAESMDLRYGKDERNRIDYFAARRDGPVLVFIHGGYWQSRAKEVFSFVAEGPLAWGINVALVGYTLAPQKRLDGIVAEIHAAAGWLGSSHPMLGGDTKQLFVSGWSAGGHLTAMAMSHPAVQRRPRDQRHLRPRADAALLHQRQAAPRRSRGAAQSRPGPTDKPLLIAYGADELPELCASRRTTRSSSENKSDGHSGAAITSRSWKSSPRRTARSPRSRGNSSPRARGARARRGSRR